MTLAELQDAFAALGEPKFRAKQVFAWLHRGAVSFEAMTNLSKTLREKLDSLYFITAPTVARKQISRLDGTIKYLWRLRDGNCVESVVMQYHHGNTVCISSEVGCPMGCKFCASTIGGLVRRLEPSELLDQVLFSQLDSGLLISNIVLMGIGEPLDNFDNVMRFLELVNSPDGMNIGMRHISLSTCGLVDKIEQLAERDLQLTLSVSLHSPDDESRSKIMPVNRRWPVDTLLSACRDYFAKTGRRISFEYTMISGVSDSPEQAQLLAKKLAGMGAHVNMIPLNNVTESGLHTSSRQAIRRFQTILEENGVTVTVIDFVHFRGHYNPVAYLKTDEDAMKLAYALVFNTKKNPAASGGENEFWDKSAVMFLASLILYILYESPLYERNLNTMMDMILECKVSEDSYDENRMDILFGELEQRDPHHPAVLQYRSFKLGSAKTLSSIMVTAVSNLHMLQSAAFAEMIATDEMFLPKLGVEKRAIFCVIPDNDDTFNFMVSILYTQLFDQLFRLADSTPEFHGTLPVHVRLMMDEFANVATPENFVKILAVARSRNISCDIILQNISQIKSKYKDDWETIIGNCDSLVYLGGNDYSTFEYISKLLGKQTIRTKGQSIGKGSHGSSSDSYQVTGRELMTPDEVRRMKRSDCLVMISGEAPVRDKKYNLFDHPNLKYTPDYRSPRGLLHRAATPIPAPEGYTMPPDYMAQAGTVSLAYVAELTCPEITEDLYDELQEWEESLL